MGLKIFLWDLRKKKTVKPHLTDDKESVRERSRIEMASTYQTNIISAWKTLVLLFWLGNILFSTSELICQTPQTLQLNITGLIKCSYSMKDAIHRVSWYKGNTTVASFPGDNRNLAGYTIYEKLNLQIYFPDLADEGKYSVIVVPLFNSSLVPEKKFVFVEIVKPVIPSTGVTVKTTEPTGGTPDRAGIPQSIIIIIVSVMIIMLIAVVGVCYILIRRKRKWSSSKGSGETGEQEELQALEKSKPPLKEDAKAKFYVLPEQLRQFKKKTSSDEIRVCFIGQKGVKRTPTINTLISALYTINENVSGTNDELRQKTSICINDQHIMFFNLEEYQSGKGEEGENTEKQRKNLIAKTEIQSFMRFDDIPFPEHHVFVFVEHSDRGEDYNSFVGDLKDIKDWLGFEFLPCGLLILTNAGQQEQMSLRKYIKGKTLITARENGFGGRVMRIDNSEGSTRDVELMALFGKAFLNLLYSVIDENKKNSQPHNL